MSATVEFVFGIGAGFFCMAVGAWIMYEYLDLRNRIKN